MKTCCYCKEQKDYSFYYIDKHSYDGYQTGCKVCCSKKHKLYRQKNKIRLAQIRKQWSINNPEKEKTHKYKYQRTQRGRFVSGKRTAGYRKIIWELTFEQWQHIISSNLCSYCGSFLEKTGYSLDRKNSSLGYTLNNVVSCCDKCNCAKSSYTVDEFKTWIEQVYNHFVKGDKSD